MRLVRIVVETVASTSPYATDTGYQRVVYRDVDRTWVTALGVAFLLVRSRRQTSRT